MTCQLRLIPISIAMTTMLSAVVDAETNDFPSFRPDPLLWTKEAVPVYSSPEAAEEKNQGAQIAILPARSEVRASIINEKGRPWSEWQVGDKPRPQKISTRTRNQWQTEQANGVLRIATEITTRTETGKRKKIRVTGYVARDNMTTARPPANAMLTAMTPTTPAALKNFLEWSVPGVKTDSQICLDREAPHDNVRRLLREFHNTRCDQIHAAPGDDRDLRKRLIDEWEKFVESKKQTPDAEWARKAEETDIIARTILHEGHEPGALADQPRGTDQCEWMLIAQTLQNRRHECTDGRHAWRGCREGLQDDLVGIATHPAEINIWMARHVLESPITSCYLRDDLLKAQPRSYTDARGRRFPAKEAEKYRRYLRAFPRAVDAAMKVLGHDGTAPVGETEENRRLRLFQATNVDRETQMRIDSKTVPVESAEAQKLLLGNLRSYYHPRDMQSCNPRTWQTLHFARSTDIRCAAGGKGRPTKYIPLVRERVQVLAADGQPLDFEQLSAIKKSKDPKFYRFRVRVVPSTATGRRAAKIRADAVGEELLDGEEICRDAKINIDDLVEPSESYACLPGGSYPQCEGFSPAPVSGRQISINLVSPKVLREAHQMLGDDFVNKAQLAWNDKSARGVDRKMIGVRCKEIKEPGAAAPPEFDGMCDNRFKTIADLPL